MAGNLTRGHLKRLASLFDVFVETGTYLGHTTAIAAHLFKTVYTIELSREIFETTRAKFRHVKKIEFIQGDSAVELRRLASLIDRPAVFFLDSHFAGGKTALGDVEVPLYAELGSICARNFGDLVIVDDYRLFGQRGMSGTVGSELYPPTEFDWTGISVEGCFEVLKQHGKMFVHAIYDDRVYILLSGEGPLICRTGDDLVTVVSAVPTLLDRMRPAVLKAMRLVGVHGLAKRAYDNYLRYRLGV